MSTRSTVTIYDPINNYRSVYGHFDGYLNGVGKTLLQNYNTPDDVSALIGMGSFSVLKPTLEESVFYTRDRGEGYDLNKATVHRHIIDIPIQDYNYLYNGHYWFYYKADRIIKMLSNYRIKQEKL